MPEFRTRRAVALAITALLTSACTVNGLSLATPDLGGKGGASARPSAQPSGGGQLGQQPGGQMGQQQQQPGGMTGQQQPGGQMGQQQPGGQPGQQQPGGMTGQPGVGASAQPGTAASSMPALITTPTIAAEVPEIYRRIYGAASMKVEGGFLVVTTQTLPDHDSVYYDGTVWETTVHEGTDTKSDGKSPGSISLLEQTFKIPLNPTPATTQTSTPMGAMGVSLNGIPFYNQLSGEGVLISHEIVSFDTFNGHPDPGGAYHYHVEPKFLTAKFGRDALLGWLIDGYPVYGPMEGDKELTSADLDGNHGHEHETPDYPTGIYHYHITADAPYINAGKFYGVAGTATRGAGGTAPGGQTGGQMGSPPPGGTGGQPGSPPPGGATGTPKPLPSGCPTPPPPGVRPSPIPGGLPSHCPTPPGGMPPPQR